MNIDISMLNIEVEICIWSKLPIFISISRSSNASARIWKTTHHTNKNDKLSPDFWSAISPVFSANIEKTSIPCSVVVFIENNIVSKLFFCRPISTTGGVHITTTHQKIF